MLPDEQLCEGLGSSQESNVEEEKEDNSPPPSNAEVVKNLDITRRRVYHNDLDTDFLTQVENILTKDMIANITQRKTNDYFTNSQ